MTEGHIHVRGARLHNLRSVTLDVPRDRIVAFTGISGSGKSSLAFGTIYAEAQRRYLESLAPYVRRLLHQMEDPNVEAVTGVPPAVALKQQRSAPSSRSTVGTVTALSNTLRMLMSRAGEGNVHGLDSDAFSPNTPEGACPRCEGQGVVYAATEDSMVPDPGLSIEDGAVASWPGAWQGKNLRDILRTLGHDVGKPWRELPEAEREWILFTDDKPVVTVQPEREAHRIQRPYQGTYTSARNLLLKSFAEAKNQARKDRLAAFLTVGACPLCGGKRLRPEALAVTFAGRDIAELAALPLTELKRVMTPREGAAGVLIADILERVAVLEGLGLGYLSAGRAAPTLSGGELQRLRLAAQLRAGLFGVVYVLDEPSAGMHPADAEALIGVLRRLKDSGNTVYVVEHDLDVVRAADWVVDIGPGAGERGGRVLYGGPVAGLSEVAESVTGRFLASPPVVPDREPRKPVGTLELRGLRRNNLRGLDVDVPLGVLCAVTGVSGAGKTSLLEEIAEAAADMARVVRVDQRPLGRTPRSNLATYTGLFDTVRSLFAGTPDAKAAGFTASRFSFNVPGGRCETCKGEGYLEVELLFLPTAYTPCPDCGGRRYNDATLAVRYRDASIAEVLGLTVEAATEFLDGVPAALRPLRTLGDVGLGYLRLGQPATELSGGEAQRVKLAAELQRAAKGALYLLDEPTTGLHPADAEVLARQLESLVDAGGSVVAAEHDPAFVAACDHVIDLGPGGGDEGGRLVAEGTPGEIAASPGSRTGPYLRTRGR
ncbi:excinuclease ABC subunit A [Actinorhabdospora filicis]|uniref:UvrABC system protein A n=1 Tax=Actinorhabdospora filicis TaxID=1785913 RepID=A0A9W6SK98_9ACTN|nr:excinuclease ABC subunit UvrA [Actinorhabdospora filicis]GLZ77793.1 excinuclease ABC subunit A [Actinorhabdospora filicis]